MTQPRSTRGYGLLERFLAARRAAMADRLIPVTHRKGRILDIGCGAYPYFLARTRFAEKVGIDKVVPIDVLPLSRETAGGRSFEYADSIRLMSFDVEWAERLPLEDATVDVVTMLAVLEHLRPERLVNVLDEVERVLAPEGIFIATTPAGWTGPILTALKWLRLVSAIEIDEHQDAYSRRKVQALLSKTRLAGSPTQYRFFECWLNLCVEVRKERGTSNSERGMPNS